MKKIGILLGLLLLPVAVEAGGACFPVGTHVVKGSVRGYDENGRNVVLPASRGISIRAVNSNGVVIAESKVRNASAGGVNFALRIPLSSVATDSSCAVGDRLECVLVEPSGLMVGSEALTVGGAREAQSVTLRLVDVKQYVSEDGTRTNEVAKAYVEAIQAWMADEAAFGGKEYDPFADYDGDGRSNYAEYLAGTNPFDRSDFLAVRSIAMEGGKAALSFEYVGGHVYGVRAARDLANPEWLAQKVRTSAEGVDLDQVVPEADPDGAGEVTIWMSPAADAAQGFYVLEAK
jgi:hypothetical protein